jgi:hypothetical protein
MPSVRLPSVEPHGAHSQVGGLYLFSATILRLPTPGAASLSFGTAAGQEFMHLDLMPTNTVRIDDGFNGPEFGTFPRGRPFVLRVTLNSKASGMHRAHRAHQRCFRHAGLHYPVGVSAVVATVRRDPVVAGHAGAGRPCGAALGRPILRSGALHSTVLGGTGSIR